jgi:hypothetical protein
MPFEAINPPQFPTPIAPYSAGAKAGNTVYVSGVLALGEGGAVLKLTPQESQQWLRALNDLRLAIGSRLEITDEDDTDLLYRLPDEDPRKPMVMAYLWLGGLQETLVTTLMP